MPSNRNIRPIYLPVVSCVKTLNPQRTMKNFISLPIIALAFVAGSLLQMPSANAGVNFLGVAAGDATTDDVILWTRAKDESNPQPTASNVQISTDPIFTAGATTTLLAGTATVATDYTVKANDGGLQA